MKNLRLFSIAILVAIIGTSTSVFAQVKVGNNPTTLNPSAVLEVESSNKGFLPPRLDIPDLTLPAPVTNPAVGLTAFNTNTTSGVGLVSWDGTRWNRLVTSTVAYTFQSYAVGTIWLGDIGSSFAPVLQPGARGFASTSLTQNFFSGTVGKSIIRVNFSTPLPVGKSYTVLATYRSNTTTVAATDLVNDVESPVIFDKQNDHFQLFTEELAPRDQSPLMVDFLVLVEN